MHPVRPHSRSRRRGRPTSAMAVHSGRSHRAAAAWLGPVPRASTLRRARWSRRQHTGGGCSPGPGWLPHHCTGQATAADPQCGARYGPTTPQSTYRVCPRGLGRHLIGRHGRDTMRLATYKYLTLEDWPALREQSCRVHFVPPSGPMWDGSVGSNSQPVHEGAFSWHPLLSPLPLPPCWSPHASYARR